MRFRTRRSAVISAAAALVAALGAGSAQASLPDLQLTPCKVKWVLAPDTGFIVDRTTSGSGASDFDVENGTTPSGGDTRTESGPGGYDTVEHDDLAYDPCP